MKKFISALLTFVILFSLSLNTAAFNSDGADAVYEDVGKYLYETVKDPTLNSVGGEWTVLGLARSDMNIPDEYFENYYQRIEKYVKNCDGILHDKKYTEYSRIIIALTSIGKNPSDVAGYNLLMMLSDYEKTVWQGVNGAIWALIALDSGNYDIPKNPDANIQATREMYIEHIIKNQTSDGGWSLSGDTADPDVTGMALQALSHYQDNKKVKSATEKGLDCLSEMQNEDGGFLSYDVETSESCVQVLVALSELGIATDDERFVKSGMSVADNLLTYYDGKSFKHIQSDTANLMATEQCFYALVALKRAAEGKNSLYDMSDARQINATHCATGLEDKNEDVKKMNVINSGKTFSDIKEHNYKGPIEDLASRGIINGKSEISFEPDSTMTRAEFATIITRGLGLPQKNETTFKDVQANDWFYNYVNTAYHYGIIKGVSENEFNPNGTITREEAAVMVTRAATLCGINTEMYPLAIRDILAQFIDYVLCSDWSQGSLAFCYNEKILDDSVIDIKPKEAVARAEIAYMLYNMLSLAKLL